MARKWNLEQLTEENLKEQIERAREAGENADANEPRAELVHYDRLDNRITIQLKNGGSYFKLSSYLLWLANINALACKQDDF